MNKAILFKRAYHNQWYIGNQKEAFVELFFRSLGFNIYRVGLGVESVKYLKHSGSLPDFVIRDEKGNVVCYVEVTGDNYVKTRDMLYERYILLNKIIKFQRLNRPVFIIFLGLRNGLLKIAEYVSLEKLSLIHI